MSRPDTLTWENFKATVLISGQQRVHRVAESPRIEFFGDGIHGRVGIWLEAGTGEPIPPELSKLTFISTGLHTRDGRKLLEMATGAPSLQRQFYHFAMAVVERVVVEKRAAYEAVLLELQCFAELLDEKPLLGIERQVGLLGELLFLERQVSKVGAIAIDSWVGPAGEPHDFRIANREFEVKTTLSPRRIHTIHGAEQLIPSHGCDLYVVSILLGPPGSSTGFTLADKIVELSSKFDQVLGRALQFRAALEKCGFRDADVVHYTRGFSLRRAMAVAHVDENFPALTRATIQTALSHLAPRVQSLQYDVDIEGLEHEEGTGAFESVVPG